MSLSPTTRLTLALYPLGAGAMAVNVFFASLLGSWIGLPVLSTTTSILLGALIALPATWAFARHMIHLARKADAEQS
ncbi:NnrT protein [Pseudoruegeria sp. SHC-113]|uniref:NnrT protein n=1 Tax=Pseudoruegeria sp. SHC-113 TaxID=2855439 RepID=UPI0021BB51B0|nr:NnrT protein [Pseudoruegeria sp. SHC-113]MCT8160156.1 NnrT protein [Pseudoruegeria sp. SHC-113]